ncbi:MAG: hypothetical protein SW833_25930, partial [Cyanobacteriota bacterium]|nr:hypothetical protein [Cyanobacteriota bacterium]
SLFIIHYSLFPIHYSLFIIPYSLFIIHYSLFIIPYSLLFVDKLSGRLYVNCTRKQIALGEFAAKVPHFFELLLGFNTFSDCFHL